MVIQRLGLAQRLDEVVGQFLDAQRDLHLDRAATWALVPRRVVDELAFLTAGTAAKSGHLSAPASAGAAALPSACRSHGRSARSTHRPGPATCAAGGSCPSHSVPGRDR